MLIRPPDQIHKRPSKQSIIHHAIHLRINQGVEEDRRRTERPVIVGRQCEFGNCHEYLRRSCIGETRVRRRTTGFIAEDRIQTFDATARVGCCGLFPGRGVAGAPYLLFSNQPTALPFSLNDWMSAWGSSTWRVLQVRLKAVNRSVGDVARKLLEVNEREPPMRRDHCGS